MHHYYDSALLLWSFSSFSPSPTTQQVVSRWADLLHSLSLFSTACQVFLTVVQLLSLFSVCCCHAALDIWAGVCVVCQQPDGLSSFQREPSGEKEREGSQWVRGVRGLSSGCGSIFSASLFRSVYAFFSLSPLTLVAVIDTLSHRLVVCMCVFELLPV